MVEDKVFLACYSNGVTRAAVGQDGSWQVDRHIEDVKVNCLADDPHQPGLVLAAAEDGAIWRSQDRGASWVRMGTVDRIVKSLAISPHDPDLIFAGTKPASVHRSVDGGASWEELTGFRRIPNRWWWFSPAEPPDFRAYVLSLAPSPVDPSVLLAGVEFGAVVRSEDGGQTWSRHRTGALRDSHSLKFHTLDGDWAYEAGGTGGGVACSRDGGRTFHRMSQGLEKNYGIVCGADPVQPEIWYVCVGSSPGNAFGDNPAVYLYRSTGGAGWQPIGWTEHPLSDTPTAIVGLPDTSGELFVGVRGGDVYHSTDYGDSWQMMPFNMGGIWFSLVIC
jgi:photosystem II stability/assembly factor-like uncharacterized protein